MILNFHEINNIYQYYICIIGYCQPINTRTYHKLEANYDKRMMRVLTSGWLFTQKIIKI